MSLPAIAVMLTLAAAQLPQRGIVPGQQPFLRRDRSSRALYARILEAEDKRAYNPQLAEMMKASHVGVRKRAALAIGRIGDPAGVLPLVAQLDVERNPDVRATVVFAVGETEDARATTKLLEIVASSKETPATRARAVEALGKIGANTASAALLGRAKLDEITTAIAATLPPPDRKLEKDDLDLAALAVVALLRLKSPGSLAPLVAQLSSVTPELRWQASNAIARLRPDPAAAGQAVGPLLGHLKDADPIVRANGARALGALKATAATGPLVELLSDADARVVASAVRALGAIGDAKTATPLGALGERLMAGYAAYVSARKPGVPDEQNLLLVVAESLGTIKDPGSLALLGRLRALDGHAGANPETEIAVAAFGEAAFFDIPPAAAVPPEWHHVAAYAQGLGAVGGTRARTELLDILSGKRFGPVDPRAISDVLTALAKLQPDEIVPILLAGLANRDVVVRATAAGLLAESQPASESVQVFDALENALRTAASDPENDARLAILDAISKQKRTRAQELMSMALNDTDYVVRRKAAELLEAAGAGSFRTKITPAILPVRPKGYYAELEVAMRGPNPIAVLSTEKGDVRIELLIHDAPMTVDNFVQLARKGYFNGILFHRVVPNFVVQGGDPRGDGNGGPGYQIRCEINDARYDRGAVGMALSGKDTGGSQFFFTHAPQPHLDGGYTVFGRVTAGMDVVDRLARGDKIVSVTVTEP